MAFIQMLHNQSLKFFTDILIIHKGKSKIVYILKKGRALHFKVTSNKSCLNSSGNFNQPNVKVLSLAIWWHQTTQTPMNITGQIVGTH